MEVITSNKGGVKLLCNGYMYVVHKNCASGIRWRCCKYGSLKCRAILTTTVEKTSPVLKTEHNHSANEEEIKVAKCVQDMKKRAKDVLAKPVQIYAEAVSTLEDSVRAVMPSEDSVKRTLRNHKAKNVPGTPVSLEDLTIEGSWCTTGEPANERFLLHDNGAETDERIIIFATDDCLTHLSSATTWYIDGNFALAPSLFMQLYVLRIKVQGVFITAAYVLLQRKTQFTYENMLRTIVGQCEDRNLFPDPTHIKMDFERSAIQAVKTVFGDQIHVSGCFYHLCQSTHKKIQELGLQQIYREDEAFRKFCGMMDGLAFLPTEDVHRGMEYLKQNIPAGAEELLNYFDTTYVSGTYRRVGNNDGVLRLRNIPAMFPLSDWNVHQTTLEDGERTNNQTEGWNHRFSNLVGQKHPTVWVLINKMRQELACDRTKIQQRLIGRLPPKKKRPVYEVLQTRLKALCEDYLTGTRDNFLNAISHNIRTLETV